MQSEMEDINNDIVIGSCEYVGSNKLGCQIIKANQVAYYKIKMLDNILHGETNYHRGRDIFVNILRNRAAGKYNKEEERYYGELVFEVLGMNYNLRKSRPTTFSCQRQPNCICGVFPRHGLPSCEG